MENWNCAGQLFECDFGSALALAIDGTRISRIAFAARAILRLGPPAASDEM